MERRDRKLLLHRREIDKVLSSVERDGYTLVPTALYWSNNKVKLEIALAKGKQNHDKRDAAKDRDWQRDKQRVMRRHNRDAWWRIGNGESQELGRLAALVSAALTAR